MKSRDVPASKCLVLFIPNHQVTHTMQRKTLARLTSTIQSRTAAHKLNRGRDTSRGMMPPTRIRLTCLARW